MDELLSVLMEIRDKLDELNNKIDIITGYGSDGISSIVSAIEDIRGGGGYDLTDVCDKLETIDASLVTIDSTILMKD